MNDNREIVVKISGNKNNPESAFTGLSKSFEKEWTNAGTLGTFPIKGLQGNKASTKLQQQNPAVYSWLF